MALPVPGKPSNGSTDTGTPQPGAAEESLAAAFSAGAADAAGAKPAAKPEKGDTAAGGTKGGGVTLAPWAEQLPTELRDNPGHAAKLAKFQKLGDMAKAYLELEGQAAGGGVPGADAAPEAAAAFWEKAGKPATAEGYPFAKDAERDGGTFAQAAFAANLTAAQAETLFKGLEAIGTQRAREAAETQTRQIRETALALQTEYGSRYPEKIELLTRGLAQAGPQVAGILAKAGLSGNPEIVKAFITFGQLTAESGGARGSGTDTPLKSIFEGGTFADYKIK
jgi:hypothetical protein